MEKDVTHQEQVINLSFGKALSLLQDGILISRKGWNGKNMYICLIKAKDYNIENFICPHTNPEGKFIPELLPWIGMKTADNKFVPWLTSQTDILAEDWQLADLSTQETK